MAIAPLEYMVLRIPEERFTGEIVPVLVAMQQAGSVRVIDLLSVTKDAAGTVTAREIHERGGEALQPYGDLVDGLQGLLTAEDVATLAAELPVSASAFIVLLEHQWAVRLGEAVDHAGGALLTSGFVSPDALERVSLELSAVATT